ncbi:hypothetical protein OC846_000981 [Tilletia horrida]|uniref:Alcohol acetyltransferase n=1 Tax=Tilletia horrida TaxID=155126 RepID=A0AAN6GX46_9BASI|nr:hypothetical protein OC846_000981 [Tilletia horrida]KAK0563899.1 hypothetical protein OC861_004579 [Tilletia horrida]
MELALASTSEVARPVSLVEQLQLAMENVGVGSVLHLGAAVLHHFDSDQDLVQHFTARVQLMLDNIPTLSQHIAMRPTPPSPKGKAKAPNTMTPHMVCDPSEPFVAQEIVDQSVQSVASASTRAATWDAVIANARQTAQHRIDIHKGPMWFVSFHKTVPQQSTITTGSSTHRKETFVVLSFSHALGDARSGRNILHTMLGQGPIPLTDVDRAPVYPAFEETGLTKFSLNFVWQFIKILITLLLPRSIASWLGCAHHWPLNLKIDGPQGARAVRRRTMMIARLHVLGLKAAAKRAPGRVTLHSTINQAMKVAIIVAHRAFQQQQCDGSARSSAASSLRPPIPSKVPFRIASQSPMDWRDSSSTPFGRFAGNIIGLWALRMSDRTDVSFWAEAHEFTRTLNSPSTRKLAIEATAILNIPPKKMGWVNKEGQSPALPTGLEGFYADAFSKPSTLASSFNYSNLGLIPQPEADLATAPTAAAAAAVAPPLQIVTEATEELDEREILSPSMTERSGESSSSPKFTFTELRSQASSSGSTCGDDEVAKPIIKQIQGAMLPPAPITALTAPASSKAQQQQQQELLLDEVHFSQTPQPGSCALFVDVAGCAVHPSAENVGGAVTVNVTTYEGFLPEPIDSVFYDSMQQTLRLCAEGKVQGKTTVADVVSMVEQDLDREKIQA